MLGGAKLYMEDEENESAISNPDMYFNPNSIFGKDPFSSNLYGQSLSSSLSALSLQQSSNRGPIGSQSSLSSRGFGTSVIAGHVTPTSGLTSYSPNKNTIPSIPMPQQQLSPNSRNQLLGGTSSAIGVGGVNFGMSGNTSIIGRNLLGQAHAIGGSRDKRGLPASAMGLDSRMGNFSTSAGNRFLQGIGLGGAFALNPGNEVGGNPVLDMSEFPSLSTRGRSENAMSGGMSSSIMPGRQAYVGIMKQPSETNEFHIQNEDFPALPGSKNNNSNQEVPLPIADTTPTKPVVNCIQETAFNFVAEPKDVRQFPPENKGVITPPSGIKRGIQTTPNGNVTNIPASMVTDQFGIAGLLQLIRTAETDQNLTSLALGTDLTTLGLNLNSQGELYQNFGGPFAETPCRPQDIDFYVPHEYLTNISIRDKLCQVKLNKYQDDILFYMFYTTGGDMLQLAVAAELFTRDWRYHREEKVWITRAATVPPVEKSATHERGTYLFFDPQTWRKVAKEFVLEYDKLEERPHFPGHISGQTS